ncbi:hypothetical protein AB0L88_09575 [Saccharopolyspora shandongensis]|uniref:hypothetical protein n=1 Tax=Saccharopolyspora shandongensis TaxID=418495 RepID=UPI003441E572
MPAASQALAASVLDTLLRVAVHPPARSYYGKVRNRIESVSLSLLPWAVTHWPVLVALTTFNGGDEPPPSVFNRHATARAVGVIQYTPDNALLALMLTASVLREAHHVHTLVRCRSITAVGG